MVGGQLHHWKASGGGGSIDIHCTIWGAVVSKTFIDSHLGVQFRILKGHSSVPAKEMEIKIKKSLQPIVLRT